jgi:hypothetical protein
MDRCYCVQFCTIVESGVKHHNSSPLTPFMDRCYCVQCCTIQSDRINYSSDLIKRNEIILTDDHFPGMYTLTSISITFLSIPLNLSFY